MTPLGDVDAGITSLHSLLSLWIESSLAVRSVVCCVVFSVSEVSQTPLVGDVVANCTSLGGVSSVLSSGKRSSSAVCCVVFSFSEVSLASKRADSFVSVKDDSEGSTLTVGGGDDLPVSVVVVVVPARDAGDGAFSRVWDATHDDDFLV